MLQKKSDIRKVCEKTPFSKKVTKNVRKSHEKTQDSLLAELGKHQTCMQKFVRKTYEIVTCWLRAKM